MNQLITTTQNERGEILVSGRELHEFLESGERYSKWISRMLSYGFVENIDFTSGQKSTVVNNGANRQLDDHILTVEMSKEISMLQRNEKGKQARLYFLELERRWNSPEMILKRAQDYLTAQVAKLQTSNLVLEQQVSELKPKATYYDMVLQNKSLLAISTIAKDYGMSAMKMNQLLHDLGIQYRQGGIWLLYAKHQDKGYTQTHTHVIDADKSKVTTKWTQRGRLFIYDLLKHEGILPMVERDESA